ncbi:MAG: adenosylmethionine--8-amino-7-oxononanoate transaminase, partial [Phycisphaerae bacterium]|nr:adenosylmethionine--8-amino-7-oxononanoate transaminase [Phycisphaerae bacterium]
MTPHRPIDAQAARRLYEADRAFLWHPFTAMERWLAEDDGDGRVVAAGEGFELIDTHGRRYIDGFASLWCNLHGHRVRPIDAAIH